MSVSAKKTWVAGEILTASDLNAEFLNIYGNGETLGWPATVSKDFAGQQLTLDADGDTLITAGGADDRIDITVQGKLLFRYDGTTASVVNGFSSVASIAGSDPSLTAMGDDTDISIDVIPKGAGTLKINGDEVATILASQVYS